MGLFDIYKQIQQAQGFEVEELIQRERFGSYQYIDKSYGVWPEEDDQEYQRVYRAQAAVYTCVKTNASKIAQLDIKILEEKKLKDGTIEKVDLTDQPEYKVFKKYNSLQTKYDFWEQVIGFLEISGECPILLDTTKGLENMFSFSPSFINVVAKNDYVVDHYLFYNAGQTFEIPKENILFLKYFNPTNPLRGLSPISAGTSEITLDLQTVNATKKAFNNGARPSGVLSTDQEMNQNEFDTYVDIMNRKYGGEQNAGKIMYVANGFKWQQMGVSNKDMEVIEQRKFTDKTVYGIYQVPPIFGMNFEQAGKLSNSKEQFALLWEGLKPKTRKIEEIFTEFVIPLITDNPNVKFKFDFTGVKELEKDKKVIMEVMEKAFSTGSASPNDIRQSLGMPREDNPALDKYYIPQTYIPIDYSTPEPIDESEKSINFVGKWLDENTPDTMKLAGLSESIKQAKQLQLKADERAENIRIFSEINQIALKVEPNFKRKVQELFNDQKIQILANIQQDKSLTNNFMRLYYECNDKMKQEFNADKVAERILGKNWKDKIEKYTIQGVNFDFQEWVDKFAEEGNPYISEAVRLAGESMADSLDSEFDLTDPVAANQIGSRTANYATIVNTTTKNDIDDILIQALGDNLSIDEASGLIEDYFDTMSGYRAARIARTETIGGINLGRMESMRQTKGVNEHKWTTQSDGNVRDSHDFLSGVTVPVGSDFPVGADYMGDPTYPSDINERCTTSPVRKG